MLKINGIFERVCCYFYLDTPIRWYSSLLRFSFIKIMKNYSCDLNLDIQNILSKLNPVGTDIWYTKIFSYEMIYSESDSFVRVHKY